MSRRLPAWLLLGALLSVLTARGQDADVRIAGTPSTKPLLAGIVRAMREGKGLRVAISSDVTSLGALGAVASGNADIAIVTKPVTGEDRARFPAADLFVVPVGMQVVALGVSNDLWDAGVRSISKETMLKIYEQKITNWSEAGGPDQRIKFFDFQQGQGIWEILASWLYGDNRKAPLPKVENVNSSEDAQNTLEFTTGSISPIAALLADGARCHALAIDVQGHLVKPTPQEVAAQTYPIVRPITAVVVGRPTLSIRVVTEYLTGPDGQALVRKYGAFGLDAVPKPPPETEY